MIELEDLQNYKQMKIRKIIVYLGERITKSMDMLPIRLLLLENTILWRKYHTYKSIDFFPIGYYVKIEENNNDLRYLLKLKDYDNLPNYPKNLLPKLQDTYNEILGQYADCIKTDEREYSEELSAEIVINKGQYDVINTWIRLAYFDVKGRDHHIKKIRGYGYEVDENNLTESLEAAHKKTGLIINKLSVKIREYQELKTPEDDGDKNTQSFEEALALIERGLQRTIDPITTSTKRWISIQNDYIKYSEELKRNSKKNGD